jgi:hypothetical protein|tara:strand:+ start:3581 stop:3826 length:246 start_codon:yes stop_codon:yes gene_type:complete
MVMLLSTGEAKQKSLLTAARWSKQNKGMLLFNAEVDPIQGGYGFAAKPVGGGEAAYANHCNKSFFIKAMLSGGSLSEQWRL